MLFTLEEREDVQDEQNENAASPDVGPLGLRR